MNKSKYMYTCTCKAHNLQMDETETETERERERDRDRQTDRQTDMCILQNIDKSKAELSKVALIYSAFALVVVMWMKTY